MVKAKKEKPAGFEYFLSKKVGKAIMDYKMLEDGDRILVAVSGGKDSMTVLKILEEGRSLNLVFQGEISTMSPKQKLFNGKIIIIRPLAYVEERECERFAKDNNFPVPHCSCPNAGKTQRSQVAKLIKQIEGMSPNFKTNIFRSLQRIKKEYLL